MRTAVRPGVRGDSWRDTHECRLEHPLEVVAASDGIEVGDKVTGTATATATAASSPRSGWVLLKEERVTERVFIVSPGKG